MAIVGHSPNGDNQTFITHVESAIAEFARTHVDILVELVKKALDLPHPDDIAAASADSQDGSVSYVLSTDDGSVSVAPAIPHTDETRAAAEAAASGVGTVGTTAENTARIADAVTPTPDPTATPEEIAAARKLLGLPDLNAPGSESVPGQSGEGTEGATAPPPPPIPAGAGGPVGVQSNNE